MILLSKMRQRVCIIGLGYVGFPTACVIANAGYSVFGVDINQKVISNIHAGNYMDWQPQLKDLFIKQIDSGNITVSTEIEPSDIYIITVQTPLDAENKPDIFYVRSAIETIQPHLKIGDLVLIESTCPIGTTEAIAKEVLAAYSSSIYLAYCPERVLPGNIVHELIYNNRIIGGVDQESGMQAANFYSSFIRGEVEITDSRTAEAVKLIENTYRDINIAYANELSMLADHIDLNIHELIRLGNKHPRVNILQPGPGVGGHCIAIDPYFLASAAPESAALILKAREVNIHKTNWVIQKINKQAKENNVKTIACLGMSYKANVADTRESPAIKIIDSLEEEFYVIAIDPYVSGIEFIHDILIEVDMIVLLVAHNIFLDIPNHLLQKKIFLDFTGVFPK